MEGWCDEPGIKMLCDVAGHVASMARNWADRMTGILEQLPEASKRDELSFSTSWRRWPGRGVRTLR
jgi:hypothetical protein